MMGTLLPALIALGGLGLLSGLCIGVAGVVLRTEEDPLLRRIKEILPGADCGGCGYKTCAALAEALCQERAEPDACPAGGPETAYELAALLGCTADAPERLCAYVRCQGVHGETGSRYQYEGLEDCRAMAQLAAGGPKGCTYGCLGGGSCAAVCVFGALSVQNGAARVDGAVCAGCGQCVKVCPKRLIAMTPRGNRVRVACHSREGGKEVRVNCAAGCIACRTCERVCAKGAIQVRDQLAAVDWRLCDQCGECAEKCPAKCITLLPFRSNPSPAPR